MTSITTRAGKGSPLTHNEVDANFTNLNNDKLDTAGIALGSAASPTLKFTGDANTGIYSPGADQLAVSTGGTERARFSSGRLLVGTSSAVAVNGITAGLQLHSLATTNGASASIARFAADAVGPQLNLGKSRNGGTLSPGGIVQNNDTLGEISFCGDDGTDITSRAARIACEVDGTPGANDMPGRLVFATTADGASSPTERMRIKSTGTINFSSVAVYADNAAAITGGLATGDVYRTSTGQLMIRY